MVGVLVALVAALGGAAAVLLPSLVMTERDKLLKLIPQEADAVRAAGDEEAEQLLREALRASARRYRYLSANSQDLSDARWLKIGWPIGSSFFVFGLAMAASFNDQMFSPDGDRALLAAFFFSLLVSGYLLSFAGLSALRLWLKQRAKSSEFADDG